MAFTEAQKNKIRQILGISKNLLNSQITFLGANLTAQDEADVIAEIDRWETSGGKFTKIHPKEANFGAEINPEDTKTDIRRNIAVLLELTSYVPTSGASMGTISIGSC